MSEMKLKFPVLINNGGNTTVNIELSTQQSLTVINSSLNQSVPFSQSEELAELYEEIKLKAYEQLAYSIQNDQAFLNYFLGGKFNYARALEFIKEKFDIEVLYPQM